MDIGKSTNGHPSSDEYKLVLWYPLGRPVKQEHEEMVDVKGAPAEVSGLAAGRPNK